ncbi:hypothetical protein [Pseudoalteromonas aurantia]|uniref:CHASE3 domain-containing protein n=1 Tax=Pseudoalteromonas aurantia 208 TaxID=1314867 RepID=A0ABR9EK11_9GAMM|nr:hypothetical protein [Pseudoalteromonas aurantia]MBE0371042.1 hypothetical protein [Pseudoalteromonas aurantia 208]
MNDKKFQLYQLSVIFSMIFALVGFSYNIWRLESTETNNNIRVACFETLKELASLEQIIYYAYYDQDKVEGNPRKGWIKVGLINDFSALTSTDIEKSAANLEQVWRDNWPQLHEDKIAVDKIVLNIDKVRDEIKVVLSKLD